MYVEKPLADTSAKMEQVAAAQERSGRLAAVGFNWRMAPAYCKAREIIDADGGAELEQFQARSPHWNYMVNKGWLRAADHFAQCILSGETPQLANAADRLWSTRMIAVAVDSRKSGEVVRF